MNKYNSSCCFFLPLRPWLEILMWETGRFLWKGSRNYSRSLPHCHFCCLILCFNLLVFLYLQTKSITKYDAFIHICYPFEIKRWRLWVSLLMKLFLFGWIGFVVILWAFQTIYSSFVGCFKVVMFYGGIQLSPNRGWYNFFYK